MKKLVTVLLLVVGIVVMTGCKTVDPVDVDCVLNPEHEDCAEVPFCERYPDDESCNVVYTYQDTYEILDMENDQVDDFETVFLSINALVNASSKVYDVREEQRFEDFYIGQVNSGSGLTKEELEDYQHPNDILLAGIDRINFSIASEVSHFEVNLDEDEEFVEDVVLEDLIAENYLGRSNVYANEDGFHYMYEVELLDSPGEIVAYYEMTLVLTEENRLVFEIVDYSRSLVAGFDYIYILYDSEVGYVVKDLKNYNDSLTFFESKVDLNLNTVEVKDINLGGYRTSTYSLYDNEFYYEKNNVKSQIGDDYESNKIAFYNEFDEMISVVEGSEKIGETYVATNYSVLYNIEYVSDWDIVYEDYLIKNNDKIAYVSTRDIYSLSNTYMQVQLDFEQLPLENEYSTPFEELSFTGISYSEMIDALNSLKQMTNPVYYDENIATIKGVTYDIRTDLLDLLLSDLPQIVYDNMSDSMIVDEILFGGEETLIDLIDCEVTPDHSLCPSS